MGVIVERAPTVESREVTEVICPRKQSRVAREKCVELQRETGCSAGCPLAAAVMGEQARWEEWKAKDAERRLVMEERHRDAYARWGKKAPPAGPRRGPTGQWKKKRRPADRMIPDKKKHLRSWERP